MIRPLVAALALAGPAAGQDVSVATGGVVRVLDRTTGASTDLDMRAGQTARMGLLTLTLRECRYPTNAPGADAFAALTVTYGDGKRPVFEGWMIASSPALSAMDHPRYDVWVLRCTTA